jgi:hypothetical protein
MSEPAAERHLGRSVWAVAAGFLFVIVLSLGTDAVLHLARVFPPIPQRMSDGLFVLATAYRTVYGVAGSYLMARLAPSKPMKHALFGGVVGTVLSTVGAVVTWNHVPSLGPHWYSLALVATALPGAWIGAKIRLAELAKG